MTSGVKDLALAEDEAFRLGRGLGDRCRLRLPSLSSPHSTSLLLGRLEIVVVPQLLAGDDLAEMFARRIWAGGRIVVSLRSSQLRVEIGHLAAHRVDAEARRLAADIDRAVIHGIAEILAGIAADHHAAALHHEAGEGAGLAADDDGAALHVDAGARADIALADEVAAARSPRRTASRRSSRSGWCRSSCSRRRTSRRGL